MKGRQGLNTFVNLAILATLAIVLLGPSGVIGRRLLEVYDDWRMARMLSQDWSLLTESASRLSGSQLQPGRTIVEFVDYECSMCRQAHADVWRAVGIEAADIVVRHLPLQSIHPRALEAAQAAICSETDGLFPEAHVALLSTDDWLETEGGNDWSAWAMSLGIGDIKAFEACMESALTWDRIEADFRLAARVGATGTPTFVTRMGVFPGVGGFQEAFETLNESESRDRAPRLTRGVTRPVMTTTTPVLFDSGETADPELSHLQRLTHAMFVGDGVVLVDRDRLLFVDLQAERVRSQTSRGEGPGDISSLPEVSRVSHGVVAWDRRLRRASRFSESGEFQYSVTHPDIGSRHGLVGALDDGSLVFSIRPPVDSMPEGRTRHARSIAVVSEDRQSLVVGELISSELVHVHDPPMYPLRLIPVIFGDRTYATTMGDRIIVADTAEDSLEVYDRMGTVVARIPMPGVRREVPDEVVRRIRDSLIVDWEARPELPHPFVKPPTPDYDAYNSVVPPIDAVNVDADGRLWFRQFMVPGDSVQHWSVFQADSPAFSVLMPIRLMFMDAKGDRVLLRTENELGVHRAQIRRMTALR